MSLLSLFWSTSLVERLVLVVERVVVELLDVPLIFLFWSGCELDDGVWVVV
jgi:hypothetical protein